MFCQRGENVSDVCSNCIYRGCVPTYLPQGIRNMPQRGCSGIESSGFGLQYYLVLYIVLFKQIMFKFCGGGLGLESVKFYYPTLCMKFCSLL